MKKLVLLGVLMTFFAFSVSAQTKKRGASSIISKSVSHAAPRASSTHSTDNSGQRPSYSGDTHTKSHGGKYIGAEDPKSHKGGKYSNPKTGNRYGKHKTK